MLKPLNDLVLIQQVKSEEKTAGGIFLPTDDKAILSKGIVLAVSDGWTTQQGTLVKLTVQVGDTVVFNPKLGTMCLDGLLVREADLLGVDNA